MTIKTMTRLVLISSLLAPGPTCSQETPPRVPLPELRTGETVVLRVAYVFNPRLEQLSPDQLDLLLAETERFTARHFGLRLTFSTVEMVSIGTLFERIEPRVAIYLMRQAYGFRNPHNPRLQVLIDTVAECLDHVPAAQRNEMRAFARPYLPAGRADGAVQDFAEALVDTQLTRLGPWLQAAALDGKPIIDNQPFNEYLMWVALGYADLPYDVIVTNQLVASVEYGHCSTHALLRGGISVGATNYSRSGRYLAYAFLSTYPFTSDTAPLPSLRGNDRYTRDEAARFAGAYLTHEVGHLLFHFGHPWSRQECVMRPSSLLRFRDWYQATQGGDCRFDSHPQMVPGAFPFHYESYETVTQ